MILFKIIKVPVIQTKLHIFDNQKNYIMKSFYYTEHRNESDGLVHHC